MLVFISDLHLTDGTCAPSIHPAAFHIFADRLRYLADRASWRADGTYRPVEAVNLVLLGDVLDLIRSRHWLQADVKPWDDVNSPKVVRVVATIIDGIISQNRHSLSVLHSLATRGTVCVAPAGGNGQPIYNAPPQPVPVHIHYMVGNHDWMLHLPGRHYSSLRHKVIQHMGLANSPNEPFPHDPVESGDVLAILRRHRVVARHGDIFDPLSFTEDRNISSLGDAIVIQLVSRFVAEIGQAMPRRASAPPLAGFSELHNVRPLLLAPVWIEGMLERTFPKPALRKHVKHTWDRLVDEFLQLSMVREHAKWSPFDLVSGLERALKFKKRLSSGWASKIGAWLNGMRGSNDSSYCEHALAEPDFRNRRARHIVYGHTHQTESIPLDASYADGYVLNQVYFNCGTWRRVYRPTQLASGDHEFVPAETMTHLSFFEGDQRGGRPFEMWTGMLGVGAELPAARRHPEEARRSQAARQRGPSPQHPMPTPHFGTTTRPTRTNTRR